MKRELLYAAACFCLFTACLDKDLYQNAKENAQNGIDTDFHFSTRSSIDVTLTATNALGERSKGVQFSVYTQNPYQEVNIGDTATECRRNQAIAPIYQGYTEANGSVTTSLPLPFGTASLFVIPETAGYGDMQEVSLTDLESNTLDISFTSPYQYTGTQSRATSRAALADRSGDGTCKGVNYKFYSYYTNDEFTPNVDGDTKKTGMMNIGQGIVEYEYLSADIVNQIDRYVPEKEFNYDGKTETVLHMKTDGEVWITMVSDGMVDTKGTHTQHNGLYFYTYTDNNIPNKRYTDVLQKSDEYRLTAVFPDVHPDATPTGTKVQLMYYNKAKNVYQSTFPAGTYVGFAIMEDGYYTNGIYKFSFSREPFCSNKVFNKNQLSHSIVFYDSNIGGYVLGMEKNGEDQDFNDIVCKLTTNPTQELTNVVTPVTLPEISSNVHGTLAFEDNWPKFGDYDFNDYVTRYDYSIVKEQYTNRVKRIKLTFDPQAIGATNTNGFGIELPIAIHNVASVTGATLETDNTSGLASVVVFNDVRESFNNATGMINTTQGSSRIESNPREVVIELQTPEADSNCDFGRFNPFLFTKERSHEIHLADYKPTGKMDTSLLGKDDDCSSEAKSIYFRANNEYPWALDISSNTWVWAYESLSNGISLAYPKYKDWFTDWQKSVSTNWFDTIDDQYLWKAK